MIWHIAKREILTRIQTRAFQVLTSILLLAVVGSSIAIGTLTGGNDEAEQVRIGVTSNGVAFADALDVGTDDLDVTIVDVANEAAGVTLIDSGEIEVLFTGDELVWESRPFGDTDVFIRTTVQQAAFGERASALDLGTTELGLLFEEVPIDERFLDGEDDEQLVRIAAAVASTLATFFFLQVWGSFLMMGVIEEKSTRVVEVLLSHITPRTLLTGKIIGLGVLALGQLLIIVAGIAAGLLVVQDIEIPSGVWSSVPLLLVTFILGYAFYAALFAAVGSTVSRQEDAQTAQLPAIMPLILGYGIAMSSIANPDSIVVSIASFIPFTSPVVLPFRVALADPPLWQVALSLAILAGSAPLMLRLAGQIYQSTLLNIGSRVPLGQAFKDRQTAR